MDAPILGRLDGLPDTCVGDVGVETDLRLFWLEKRAARGEDLLGWLPDTCVDDVGVETDGEVLLGRKWRKSACILDMHWVQPRFDLQTTSQWGH